MGGLLFALFLVVAHHDPAPARPWSRPSGGSLAASPWWGPTSPPRLAGLRRDTITLLRTRGRSLTFWTVAGHANLYLLLVLCLRAVGVTSSQLSAASILAAFAFGRLVTAVPLTPGGLGVMEVSLTAALGQVGAGAGVGAEPDPAAVVAAVLLFRFASLVVPIPLGALAWLVWTGPMGRPHRPQA